MKTYIHYVLSVLLLYPLLFGFLLAGHVYAQPHALRTYNCPDPNGHCYGTMHADAGSQSPASSRFWGATTSIDARILAVNSKSHTFLTNEVWLSDDLDPGSCIYMGGSCWIEVGYSVENQGNVQGVNVATMGTHMFWSDVRAYNISCLPSCGYNEHVVGLFTLASSDIGKKVVVTISKAAGTGQWTITGSLNGKRFTATSTNNFMNGGDNIEFGEELGGTGGTSGVTATAQTAHFDSNRYQASSGGAWKPITSAFISSGSNPPWVGWTYSPSSSHPGGSAYACTMPSTGFNPC